LDHSRDDIPDRRFAPEYITERPVNWRTRWHGAKSSFDPARQLETSRIRKSLFCWRFPRHLPCAYDLGSMIQAGSQFDRFTPSVLIPMKEVERRTSYKKSRIYQWIKEGTFPHPARPGRWDVSEVENWICRSKANREGNDDRIAQNNGSRGRHDLDGPTLPTSISANRQDPIRCTNCDFAKREVLQLFKELGLVILDKPERVKELERENKKLRQLIAQLAGQTDGGNSLSR